ncbi:MAG: hypothetical protein HC814_03025, partial [Rhodobacteraceae bacterium]|nr:hypothetical protein [Paracoccaceae bacterium]
GSSSLGSAPITVDVLAALRKGLADGSASVWQSGPLASQARVEVDVPGSMRLKFDVTAFKDGQISVDATFANDEAMEVSGGRVAYQVVARLDGATVISETVSQGQYQTWHREVSSGGANGTTGLGDAQAGWLNIRSDVEYLKATGAVAQYDLSIKVDAGILNGYGTAIQAATWDDPLAANGVMQAMGTAGAAGSGVHHAAQRGVADDGGCAGGGICAGPGGGGGVGAVAFLGRCQRHLAEHRQLPEIVDGFARRHGQAG